MPGKEDKNFERLIGVLDKTGADRETRFRAMKDILRAERGEISLPTVFRNAAKRVEASKKRILSPDCKLLVERLDYANASQSLRDQTLEDVLRADRGELSRVAVEQNLKRRIKAVEEKEMANSEMSFDLE